MRITVDMVMAEGPCPRYPRERVEELWAGREALSVREVAVLAIHRIDRAWLLSKMLLRYDLQSTVTRRIIRDQQGDRKISSVYHEWLAGEVRDSPCIWTITMVTVSSILFPAATNNTEQTSCDTVEKKYLGWIAELIDGLEMEFEESNKQLPEYPGHDDGDKHE